MKTRLITPILTLAITVAAGAGVAAAQYQQGTPPPQQGYGPPQGQGPGQNYGQGYGSGQGGWDAPPQEFNNTQRQGFHDGIRAARQDSQAQVRPNPAQHVEFRHPQVPFPARQDYRDSFRRGYSVAMQHMQGGGPGPR